MPLAGSNIRLNAFLKCRKFLVQFFLGGRVITAPNVAVFLFHGAQFLVLDKHMGWTNFNFADVTSVNRFQIGIVEVQAEFVLAG